MLCKKEWHISEMMPKEEEKMAEEETKEPTVSISIVRKLPGEKYGEKFGATDVFFALSNIKASTTPDEIDDLLEQGNLAYTKIVQKIRDKVTEMRGGDTWDPD